jgi:hypothetical protein
MREKSICFITPHGFDQAGVEPASSTTSREVLRGEIHSGQVCWIYLYLLRFERLLLVANKESQRNQKLWQYLRMFTC